MIIRVKFIKGELLKYHFTTEESAMEFIRKELNNIEFFEVV